METKPLERHNAAADEKLIDKGACGQKHLPTGRVCVLPALHSGGCDFRMVDDPVRVVESARR
jgi:hypothetical protein